jgi:hypothetical protein
MDRIVGLDALAADAFASAPARPGRLHATLRPRARRVVRDRHRKHVEHEVADAVAADDVREAVGLGALGLVRPRAQVDAAAHDAERPRLDQLLSCDGMAPPLPAAPPRCSRYSPRHRHTATRLAVAYAGRCRSTAVRSPSDPSPRLRPRHARVP